MRITPAPAGKTEEAVKIHPNGEDHPRTCGENKKIISLALATLGSPPHLRGKPNTPIFLPELVGITPAPAGKTS